MGKKYLGPVVVDIEGLTLTDEDKKMLANPWVGGIILFGRNYKDRQQLEKLVQGIRGVNSALIVAVDHEGGRVQRFRSGFSRIPAMQQLGVVFRGDSERGLALTKSVGWLLAAELLASGLDISFAPVLDVDCGLSDIIGDRSFGQNPEDVTLLAAAFMDGMHEAGMATTGKHFPGHGGIKEDSHLELPVDDRTLDELEQRDIGPFRSLLSRTNALMPAHIQFPRIDALPVGFSAWWLKEYLRQKLGFKGVIFSDDLSMEGAVGMGGYGDRAIKALQAGCNAVLVCNNRKGALEVVECLHRSFDSVVVSGLESMRAQQSGSWDHLQQGARWREVTLMLDEIKG